MIRHVVQLLTVAAAVGAVWASSAQALEFTASEYPAVVSGEQTAGNTHVLTYAGREVTCETVEFKPIGSTSGPTTSLLFEPAYENCHAVVLGNKLPVTQTTNGCRWNKTIGGSLSGNQTHLECPSGHRVDIHVYSDAKHKEEVCHYDIEPQSAGGFNWLNKAVDAAVTIFTTWVLKRIEGSALVCGPAEANATYVGEETTVSATSEGSPVEFDVG